MENILKKSYKMFINGEWVNSSNGIMVKTYAPYNNELLSDLAKYKVSLPISVYYCDND